MKNLQNLGKILEKAEQRQIFGGEYPPECSATLQCAGSSVSCSSSSGDCSISSNDITCDGVTYNCQT